MRNRTRRNLFMTGEFGNEITENLSNKFLEICQTLQLNRLFIEHEVQSGFGLVQK